LTPTEGSKFDSVDKRLRGIVFTRLGRNQEGKPFTTKDPKITKFIIKISDIRTFVSFALFLVRKSLVEVDIHKRTGDRKFVRAQKRLIITV
jgi:hypothetical protein